MSAKNLYFISFEKKENQWVGFISLETVVNQNIDVDSLLHKAINIYERSIAKLTTLIKEIKETKHNRKPVQARTIWLIGDAIFELKNKLEEISLEIDGLYEHLTRDLEVKRKWLEKVIIFRRYISDKENIPQSLNWGKCEKGTRKVALRIQSGLNID